jgi:hypothetical protein
MALAAAAAGRHASAAASVVAERQLLASEAAAAERRALADAGDEGAQHHGRGVHDAADLLPPQQPGDGSQGRVMPSPIAPSALEVASTHAASVTKGGLHRPLPP